jgi:hypothetical protein
LSTDSTFDRISHQKKVKEWFLNPKKSHREIENEQRKHSGKCIYHLSKSHPTADCNIKKECEKLLMDKKDMVSTPSLLIALVNFVILLKRLLKMQYRTLLLMVMMMFVPMILTKPICFILPG